jgi:peptidoglycan/LPS O-acetylase OafA/YrhL
MLSSPPVQYRPDIDGLRAIAVMLVVGFHAFPEAVPGGFIGVDIFFVISGFLITGIIVREFDQQHFSLLAFYNRRVRRIFPALIVVLCTTLVLGWLWMLPAAYAQLSADVSASAAFFANIASLLQSGYFDLESGKKPLLHLWSLGIEEQFYLFWPLILMLIVRMRLNILAAASVIGIASFVLNVALIGSSPVATFYLPFTRAWELLAGAALACGWNQISQSGTASNLRASIGILLIAAAAAVLDSKSAFPGWWAVLPVAGAALLLSAPAAWGCRHLLAGPVLVWIGLISYPLYLWHWPLLVFFGIVKFAPLTLLERGLIVGLSFALAWLTYRFVESNFRSGRPNLFKIGGLCTGMVLIAVFGGIVVEGRGFDFRLPPEIRDMANMPTQLSGWRLQKCFLEISQTSFADSCVDHDRRPLVFVWGDSTAAALTPGLRKAQQTHTFGVAQFTSSSCKPVLNIDVRGAPNCRATNDKILSLAQDIKPDIVLLHGYWEDHFEGLTDTVIALRKHLHARIIVLGSVPTWKLELPSEVLRYFMLHHRLIPERSSRDVSSNEDQAAIRAKLLPLGVEFISAWDAMCNGDGCLTRTGETARDISASDRSHLTEKGSEFLIHSIIDQVLGAPTTK